MNEFQVDLSCGKCGFDGPVTAWEDETLGIWGWTCPNCGKIHEEDLGEEFSDFDDDIEWVD